MALVLAKDLERADELVRSVMESAFSTDSSSDPEETA